MTEENAEIPDAVESVSKNTYRYSADAVRKLPTYDEEWDSFFPDNESVIISTNFRDRVNPKRRLEAASTMLSLLKLVAKDDRELQVWEISVEGSIPMIKVNVKDDSGDWKYLGKIHDFSDRNHERIVFGFDPSAVLNGRFEASSGEGFVYHPEDNHHKD